MGIGCSFLRSEAKGSESLTWNADGKVDILKLLAVKDSGKPHLFVCGSRPLTNEASFEEKNSRRNGPNHGDLGNTMAVTCKKGKKKGPNQDDFVLLQTTRTAIYGVFDGHGPEGHRVSNFVASKMMQYLVCDDKFTTDPCRALSSSFLSVQGDCRACTRARKFDCEQSGTTAAVLLDQRPLKGPRQFCIAHVGDSRIVVGCRSASGQLVAIDLTIDHKPNIPKERERIYSAGGVVRKNCGDENDRVYVKNELNPGLAMSRSIGDLNAASVGVICDPEVSLQTVDANWLFVLLCTDGIWEFLTSQEAVELVGQRPPDEAGNAAQELATEAQHRWMKNESNTVDDITVILVWLRP